MIPVNTPQISVKLTRTVTQTNTVIDLTPFLNDGSSVTTHKAVNSPSNGFTIRLGDQYHAALNASIYGLVEPMDVVEIRMSRVKEPKIVMRGIVTDIALDESVGSDGKPMRMVTISGGDCGCFLRMIQISFQKGSTVASQLEAMSARGGYFEYKFGIPFIDFSADVFITKLTIDVLNYFIAKIGNKSLPDLWVAYGSDDDDHVYPHGFQTNPEGTMWSHIQKHGNLGPFYELLFEDEETETVLYYRKPPFKHLSDGSYIFEKAYQKTTSGYDVIQLSPSDITGMRRSRSEKEVVNFYIVRSANAELRTSQTVTRDNITGDGNLLSIGDYENSHEDRYGFRCVEEITNHGSLLTQSKPGQTQAEYEAGGVGHAEYMRKQVKYLQDSNKDNVLFESGSIRCNGSPDYKPGRHFSIDWGNGIVEEVYVTSVSHSFEPYKGFVSTLQYIRGTGYKVRKAATGNPYFYGKGVYQ